MKTFEKELLFRRWGYQDHFPNFSSLCTSHGPQSTLRKDNDWSASILHDWLETSTSLSLMHPLIGA